jgi:hypothetical protein
MASLVDLGLMTMNAYSFLSAFAGSKFRPTISAAIGGNRHASKRCLFGSVGSDARAAEYQVDAAIRRL